jgi:predicted DNA-binding transcriptional regulator YafY
VNVPSDVLGVVSGPQGEPSPWARRLAHAVDAQRRVQLHYADRNGAITERAVRPLALFGPSEAEVLIAWCDRREDFRVFRLDRILDLRVRRDRFEAEPGKTLADYSGWV